MRILETKVYSFDELSDKAQARALDYCREFQVDHDWWESMYDDAEEIGLTIASFDFHRGNIAGTLDDMPSTISRILAYHGPDCATFSDAQDCIYALSKMILSEEGEIDEEDYDSIRDEFRRALLESYLVKLRREYEYLTSDKSVSEMIQANKYEFDESGRRV